MCTFTPPPHQSGTRGDEGLPPNLPRRGDTFLSLTFLFLPWASSSFLPLIPDEYEEFKVEFIFAVHLPTHHGVNTRLLPLLRVWSRPAWRDKQLTNYPYPQWS